MFSQITYFEAAMVRFFSILPLFLSLITVSGCESVSQTFSNNSPQLVASPDKVSAMLADAADRASLALETLAAVEYARSPGVSISPVVDAPAEMRRAVTVNWVGPVEPIAKTLADRAGYGFTVVGHQPPIAVVVSVDAENRPVIDILRDIGLQLGMRADVRVDGTQRMVEVHYAPNTGVGG